MSTQFWIDGQPADGVPVDDRGLRYGDGVFETMAVVGGAVQTWARHCSRLRKGCEALGIPSPDDDVLADDLAALDSALGVVATQALRLTVTRGGGGHGYAPGASCVPRRMWSLAPWPEEHRRWSEEGLRLHWLTTTLAIQPALAGLKHLNRLEQVLAAAELSRSDAQEGLVFDSQGYVVEAVSGNVFIRRGDDLLTPALDRCGVAGVARERVLAHAATLGYRAVVTRLRRTDVALADEVFITNVLRGARPAARLGPLRWTTFPAARAVHDMLTGRTLLP